MREKGFSTREFILLISMITILISFFVYYNYDIFHKTEKIIKKNKEVLTEIKVIERLAEKISSFEEEHNNIIVNKFDLNKFDYCFKNNLDSKCVNTWYDFVDFIKVNSNNKIKLPIFDFWNSVYVIKKEEKINNCIFGKIISAGKDKKINTKDDIQFILKNNKYCK